MKVEVLQENLARATSLSSRFVSARAQLPVLSNILLSGKGTKLELSSTNLEISLNTSIGAKVIAEGQITVPARVLSDLIGNLPRGPLTLTAEKETLTIESEHFNGNILGLNPSEFPEVPSTLIKPAIIETKQFLSSLEQVIGSASSDVTRPILTGVEFLSGENTLQMVGTDGFRLSRKKISTKESLGFGKVIVPKIALLELGRIFADETSLGLEVKEEDKQVLFGTGDTTLSSRLIEGDLPPYDKIIPNNFATTIRLSREELLRGVKVASVIARDSGYVARVIVGKEGLTISAESARSGSQKIEIEGKVEGPELEVLYNLHFIEEFLGVANHEEVIISLNDSGSPGVFRDALDESFLHLIMPVKL